MATYTVTVKKQCAGGRHITFTVKRDGTAIKDVILTKDDIMDNELSVEDVLPFYIRLAIKNSGATTIAQAKTAIEAAQWVI